MKKNRDHKRSFASGFVDAKCREKEVVAEAKEEVKNEPATEKIKPTRILWYSPESLTADQLLGLKMIYGENIEFDTVYDVPCHPNAIRDRIIDADIVAFGFMQYESPLAIIPTFARQDLNKWYSNKVVNNHCIYTYVDGKKDGNCWTRWVKNPFDYYSEEVSKIVSYSQIRVWRDLTEHIKIDYSSIEFMPQSQYNPACIIMNINEKDGHTRIYKYPFVEEHEFPYGHEPMLEYWVNCDSICLPYTDVLKIKKLRESDDPFDRVLGYQYHEALPNEDLTVGYFTPIYIDTFYPELGDAISS